MKNTIDCNKCGIVFNYITASTQIDHETDYQQTKIYVCKCPVCKEEYRYHLGCGLL